MMGNYHVRCESGEKAAVTGPKPYLLTKKVVLALMKNPPFSILSLKNNYDSIDYPKYKEANYFIGSGAVESGHKSTSKERMCLQGMRWCTDSGQYVLSSKMKYDSGLWHSYVVPLIHRRLAAIPLG